MGKRVQMYGDICTGDRCLGGIFRSWQMSGRGGGAQRLYTVVFFLTTNTEQTSLGNHSLGFHKDV